jgi:hypothetical protein
MILDDRSDIVWVVYAGAKIIKYLLNAISIPIKLSLYPKNRGSKLQGLLPLNILKIYIPKGVF